MLRHGTRNRNEENLQQAGGLRILVSQKEQKNARQCRGSKQGKQTPEEEKLGRRAAHELFDFKVPVPVEVGSQARQKYGNDGRRQADEDQHVLERRVKQSYRMGTIEALDQEIITPFGKVGHQ